MVYTIIVCIMAYIGTNIDDMFINMLLFSSAKSKKEDFAIVMGKYIGTGALVMVSVLGGIGLQTVVGSYAKFLGIVPILLGLKRIYDNVKGGDDADNIYVKSGFMLSTAAVTIASGADNIGVYVPLFADFMLTQLWIMAGVFIVMTAVWCAVGKSLTNLPAVKSTIERYRHIITPAVYICLGLYILIF